MLVAGRLLTGDDTLGVLAANRAGLGLGAGEAAQGPQHLDLFVANRARVHVGRRLHGHEAEKLQHVVLQHVPQSAVLVVVGPAVADALGLGHRDLHVVDGQVVPQRLEQGVGEAAIRFCTVSLPR